MEAEILVPTELNEIPLKSYQQFMDSYEKSNDEEFLCQKMVQIFCGLRLRDVFSVKWSDVKEITIHLSEMFKNKPSFQHKFKLQGVEFGFITDLENMSFGEYIDLTQNLDKVENWHKAMAVMYRPITERRKEKYEIEEYNGTNSYAEVMKFAPLGVVLGSQVFFLDFNKRLTTKFADIFKKRDDDEGNETDFSERTQFAERWGWYSSIYAIANGKLQGFRGVTKLPIQDCLTWLTFEKQKRNIEHNEMQRQLKK